MLGRGDVLSIYPGDPQPGRPARGRRGGPLRLATGAPIVPVAMVRAFEPAGAPYLPAAIPGSRRGRNGARQEVVARHRRRPGLLRAVTDEVMDRIAEMSGQERVDEYASDVKRRLRAEQERSADPRSRRRRR